MAIFEYLIGNPLYAFLISSLFKRGKRKTQEEDLDQSDLRRIKSRQPYKVRLCTRLRSKSERRLTLKGKYRANNILEIDNLLKT